MAKQLQENQHLLLAQTVALTNEPFFLKDKPFLSTHY